MPDKVDQPWGHSADGKPVSPGPNADNPAAIGPAGTVRMTLGDWAKFISLHLLGDASNPNRQLKLLQAGTFNQLHRPGAGAGDADAFGWAVLTRNWAKGSRPGDVGLAYSHSGSNTYWFCTVWIAPEKNLAFIAATNQGGDTAGAACDQAIQLMIQQAGK